MRAFFFLLVLFANFWTLRIFQINALIGLMLILSSCAFYLYLEKRNKLFLFSFWFLFVLLVGLQINSTQKVSLTELANDDVRVKDMRLLEYSPATLRVGYWLEARKESVAFFRALKNFSELIDPNLYFFANHPRERIGFVEFEKFPYVFLPFFIIGMLYLMSRREKVLYFSPFLASIAIFSFLGSKSVLGPMSMFPLVVVASSLGIEKFYRILNKNIFIKALAFLLIFLVFIQVFSYAKY